MSIEKKPEQTVPPTFCPLPWKHFFVNIGGEVQVCCTSEERDNNIKSTAGRSLKIQDSPTASETMNLPFMKNLRRQLLNGEWPEFCHRCKVDEEHGGTSRRNNELRRYSPEALQTMIRGTAADGEIAPAIDFLDLRLGSTCNLSCRMCSPRASSKWFAEWKGLTTRPFEFSPAQLAGFQHQTWYKDAAAREKVLGASENLRFLHFAGGEPLIVPEMQDILRTLIERGVSKNIQLSYNTNFTRIPENLPALWRQFKTVHLYMSIDGFGATNEYIRTHSRWSTIAENIAELDRSFTAWNVSEALLSCTVQAYNVHRLDQLFDFTLSLRNIEKIPQLILLHWPEIMQVGVLPNALRDAAKAKLIDLRTRLQTLDLSAKDRARTQALDEVLSFMELDRSNLWPRFVEVNLAMDQVKKQNFFATYPEFAPYWPSQMSEVTTASDSATSSREL